MNSKTNEDSLEKGEGLDYQVEREEVEQEPVADLSLVNQHVQLVAAVFVLRVALKHFHFNTMAI